MCLKQCHIPPKTGNGKHSTYNGDEWGMVYDFILIAFIPITAQYTCDCCSFFPPDTAHIQTKLFDLRLIKLQSGALAAAMCSMLWMAQRRKLNTSCFEIRFGSASMHFGLFWGPIWRIGVFIYLSIYSFVYHFFI